MTASTTFFVLLVLACPLMMMLMMRGGHGHRGHSHEAEPREASTEDLRRQRDELDRKIEQREGSQFEQEREPTVWGSR